MKREALVLTTYGIEPSLALRPKSHEAEAPSAQRPAIRNRHPKPEAEIALRAAEQKSRGRRPISDNEVEPTPPANHARSCAERSTPPARP